MNIKYRVYESREDFKKAAETGDCKFRVTADLHDCSAEDFADLLLDFAENDSWPDCSEKVRFFVIDGESDDARDYSPLEGQLHRGLFEKVITEFKDKRPDEDVQDLVNLLWDSEYRHDRLREYAAACLPVYESYHMETYGFLDDEEAKEKALNSADGVRERIFVRQGLSEEEELDVHRWRNSSGSKVTTADCYLRISG